MNAIYQATEQYLKNTGWEYENIDSVFHCELETEYEIENVSLHVDTSEDTLIAFAALQHKIDSRHFDKVLKMLNVINMAVSVGSVFLDEEEGMIICRYGQVYHDGNINADKDVDRQVNFAIHTVGLIGDVLLGLEDGTYEPEEAAFLMLGVDEDEEE